MTEPFSNRATTRVAKIVKATRKAVYQAFLDPDSVAAWLPANNMSGHVHVFDARKGGRFTISLTYQDPEHSLPGKTSEDTDTGPGRFAELVPYTKIVAVVEFESEQPEFTGETKFIASFADADGGTEVTILCEDIPKSIRPEDHEMNRCRSWLRSSNNYAT
jgi:uncharacterized protein YndB with AHSA1/START domain